jgi:hypothetical protein
MHDVMDFPEQPMMDDLMDFCCEFTGSKALFANRKCGNVTKSTKDQDDMDQTPPSQNRSYGALVDVRGGNDTAAAFAGIRSAGSRNNLFDNPTKNFAHLEPSRGFTPYSSGYTVAFDRSHERTESVLQNKTAHEGFVRKPKALADNRRSANSSGDGEQLDLYMEKKTTMAGIIEVTTSVMCFVVMVWTSCWYFISHLKVHA